MTTPEFTIKEITPEEHLASLWKELEGGMYKAVEARCDEIHHECVGVLNYTSIGYVQEQLCEILDLIRMSEENDDGEGEAVAAWNRRYDSEVDDGK